MLYIIIIYVIPWNVVFILQCTFCFTLGFVLCDVLHCIILSIKCLCFFVLYQSTISFHANMRFMCGWVFAKFNDNTAKISLNIIRMQKAYLSKFILMKGHLIYCLYPIGDPKYVEWLILNTVSCVILRK